MGNQTVIKPQIIGVLTLRVSWGLGNDFVYHFDEPKDD
jgi:hypothetical protein